MSTATSTNNGMFQGEYGEPVEHVEEYQFPVKMEKLTTANGIEVPDRYGIVRTDNDSVLGTVGSNYKLLSHADAIDPILNHLKRKKQDVFKRIALTQGGARMYANIYFPNEEIEVGGRKSPDTFWPGITVINSLDGTLKYHLEASIYRLICTNGMRVPTRIAGGASVHSKNKNYGEMVEQILEFIGNREQFGMFQNWAGEVVRAKDVEALVEAIIKDKKSTFPIKYKEKVIDYLHREEQFGVVSVWNLYNSFTSVLEHNVVREKGKMDRARQLEENIFGVFESKFPLKTK